MVHDFWDTLYIKACKKCLINEKNYNHISQYF